MVDSHLHWVYVTLNNKSIKYKHKKKGEWGKRRNMSYKIKLSLKEVVILADMETRDTVRKGEGVLSNG